MRISYRLIFLHYYHHATVLIFVWIATTDLFTPGRWFMCMNYAVHSLMYSYYAFKAKGFRVPKSIAITITLLQIIQMIFGFFISCYVFTSIIAGADCDIPFVTVNYSMLMYSSYLVLFIKFFVDVYFASCRKET